MTGHLAEHKARLARSWESVPDPMTELPPIVLVTDAPHAPGWAVWQVGLGPTGPRVACPDLHPTHPVPDAVARRYFERIAATARGHCHRCGAVASVNLDPTTAPAAWSVLQVSVGLDHTPGCPCEFTDADRQWLDPRALEPR